MSKLTDEQERAVVLSRLIDLFDRRNIGHLTGGTPTVEAVTRENVVATVDQIIGQSSAVLEENRRLRGEVAHLMLVCEVNGLIKEDDDE